MNADSPTTVITPAATPDRGARCGAFVAGIAAATLIMSGQPELGLAVLAAGVVTVGNGWAWLHRRWSR